MKDINDLPKNVHDRLEYLEFMLRFRGWVSRADLTERFGLGEAAATRDIRLYREHAEKNLKLNQKTKKYEINEDTFTPLFAFSIQSALSKLRTTTVAEALGLSEFDGVMSPPRLAYPSVEVLSAVTRAISSSVALRVTYKAVKSGQSEKLLYPLAIFDNGIHWYLRAFDPDKNEYRVYALTRFVSVEMAHDTRVKIEIKNQDHQWTRMVELELVSHPNPKNVRTPETITHDFNMKDGKLKLTVRATVVGYWLRHWNVDCTEDHSLEGFHYQLWLKNHQTLYGVESRNLAPGLSEYHEQN
ncbi:WYL domain-containing protein [Rheinheimera sp. 1928-s]|uniref:helix-turn-helix transcriptional regulator n=1 Tax=Rheinheimera sp. 1928-s TaxID=3033803 RepID=UPI0026053A2C|nr:WYL domain-containing protein [Rheinheimera sp. 1928-s]MDF3123484.1 WYL domain-containing protein [Rheinheimera sp. 1928-s]